MKNNNCGFTLIEMIVVVAVIGIALPALFSIIFIVMRQQVKVLRLAEVKRQGDYVIDVMGTTLRTNAVGVYSNTPLTQVNEVCTGSPSTATFTGVNTTVRLKDKNGDDIRFYVDASNIITFSSSGNYSAEGALTTDKLRISNFTITCDRNVSFSPATITLAFSLCYLNSGDTQCPTSKNEEIATLDYATKIKLRNQ